MPVQIGAKAHNFNDPTGLLSDCHRRIEMFMGSLEGVAKVIDSAPDQDTKQALETAIRYFHEAAPKHTADEEESLFPRLRKLRSPEVESAFSKLEGLEGEHRWAESLHAQVEAIGLEYLASGHLAAEQVRQFREAVGKLGKMYEVHIATEDETLFPVAAKILSDGDKRAIAAEMAKRRQVPLTTLT